MSTHKSDTWAQSYPQKTVDCQSYPRINGRAELGYPRINGRAFTHKWSRLYMYLYPLYLNAPVVAQAATVHKLLPPMKCMNTKQPLVNKEGRKP